MAPIASRGQSQSAAARSLVKAFEGTREFLAKQSEFALDPASSSDHHVVGAGEAQCWHEFARESPETAFHSVADHGAADLLGDRKTNAHCRIRIFAITDQQNETWGCRAPTAVRGKEIGAPLECS